MMEEIDFSAYVGEWVITCGNKVIAHAKDLSVIREDIKKCRTTPTITRVPQEEILIF
ncbi:hypothetical protein HY490_02295 [Candidatus Woesearchaeota archaeon]|nr:hypothetical protein [Candidatus Woesearchaeota archaeon]